MRKFYKLKILNLGIALSILLNAGFNPVMASETLNEFSGENITVAAEQNQEDSSMFSEPVDSAVFEDLSDSILNSDQESEYIETNSRLIVKYLDENGNKVDDVNKIYINPTMDAVIVEPDTDIDSYTESLLAENDNIEYVQPDYQFILCDNTSETDGESDLTDTADENTKNINESIPIVDTSTETETEVPALAPEEDVVVAVIDSGIDIEHEAIKDSIFINDNETVDNEDSDNNGYVDDVSGWDFVNNSPLSYEHTQIVEYSHGTHIAGIIAGSADEIQGAHSNAKILPLKAFDSGCGYTSDIIRAINYAEEIGADIVNCSFSSNEDNRALQEIISNSSMIFVCAAGNQSQNIDECPVYPASYDSENVISVAATDNDNNLAYFSNYGNTVDLAANGCSILSSVPENEYGNSSGTSSAAAYVSEIISEILSERREDSIFDIKERILSSTDTALLINGKEFNTKNIETKTYISSENSMSEITPECINQISAGGYHSAIMVNNDVYLFGSLSAIDGNYYWGEDDLTAPGAKMFGVKPPYGTSTSFVVKKISTRGDHNLILLSDGTVRSIGANQYGQLGVGYVNGYIADGYESTWQVLGLSNIVDIAAGHQFSMALDSSGRVYAWGNNKDGQVGNNNSYAFFTTPQLVSGLTDVKSISAGHYHALAQKADGSIYGWGRAYNGALGELPNEKYYSPHELNISDVKKIIAGTDNSFFIKSDKTVYAYGLNMFGQLGDGTISKRTALTKINIDNVADISSNLSTVFLKEDGSAYGCGSNAYGQLGVGYTLTNERNIMHIPGTYTAVSVGGNHTLFLSENGVYSAGRNQHKQCGFDNIDSNYITPTLIDAFGNKPATDDGITIEKNVELVSGEPYTFAVTISNMENLYNKIFIVSYDSTKLSLEDVCAQTWEKDMSTGKAADTDITILSKTLSQIQFKVNKTGLTSGTVNLIGFKALSTGTTSIKVEVK